MLSVMHGGIAQLGERLNGIQEVSGSIPLISTTWKPHRGAVFLFSAFNCSSDIIKLLINMIK